MRLQYSESRKSIFDRSPLKVKLASNEGTTNTTFEIQPYVLSAPAPAGASMAQHATAHSVPLSRGRHRLFISGDVIRDQLASGRFNAKPAAKRAQEVARFKVFQDVHSFLEDSRPRKQHPASSNEWLELKKRDGGLPELLSKFFPYQCKSMQSKNSHSASARRPRRKAVTSIGCLPRERVRGRYDGSAGAARWRLDPST